MKTTPRPHRWFALGLLLVHPVLVVALAAIAACSAPEGGPAPAPDAGDEGEGEGNIGEGEGEGEGAAEGEGEGEGDDGEGAAEGEGEGGGEGEGEGPAARLACDAPVLALGWDGAPLVLTGDTRGRADSANYDGECQSQVLVEHHDLVYSLVAPRTGRIAAELSADFDGVVYALRGACGAVERAACGPGGPALLLDVAGAEPLFVVVDGRATDEEGDFTLRLSYADVPANDTCAAAQVVSAVAGTEVGVEGTLVGASADLEEPFDCHGLSADGAEGRDVFFDVVAPGAGTLEITLDAAFDAVLAAPGGCDVALTPADRCDVYSPRLVLPTAAGEHHLIAVDGNDAADLGAFTLRVLARSQAPTLSLTESCAATAVVSAPAPGSSARYQIELASLANDLSCASACSSFGCAGSDGVLRIESASAGTLRIEAEGMDTVLSAWPGAACGGAPQVCADTGAFGDVLREQVHVSASAGGTTTLVVDVFAGFSTVAPVILTLEMQP